MIDQGKFQRGRGWAYLVGIAVFVAVVAYRFVVR